MKQPQESAPEAEPQRPRGLGLVGERRVVEAQFLEGVAQVGVGVGVGRVEAREDHRLHLVEAGEGGLRGAPLLGDGVADLAVSDLLDSGDHPADHAGRQLVRGPALGREDADLLDRVGRHVRHQADLRAAPHAPLDDPHEHDDAAVGVVPGIEDQRLERLVRRPLRVRHARDDRLEDLLDAGPLLGAREDRAVRRKTDHLLDLLQDPVRLGARQIDLVDDRDDLEVVLDGEVGVGEGLRLDPLARVHDQERPLAGGEAARDLVGEVHVPRGVDQVEAVGLAVLRPVVEGDGVGLDRDPPLALEVHRVQELVLLLAVGDRPAPLEKTVREGRLPVVDVGDDREIPDAGGVHGPLIIADGAGSLKGAGFGPPRREPPERRFPWENHPLPGPPAPKKRAAAADSLRGGRPDASLPDQFVTGRGSGSDPARPSSRGRRSIRRTRPCARRGSRALRLGPGAPCRRSVRVSWGRSRCGCTPRCPTGGPGRRCRVPEDRPR